jgi:acyl-CoA thioesterase FadM
MSKPTDWQPYAYPIDVYWGHCDPANIAFTGQLMQFALQSIDAWWRQRIGHDWYAIENDLDVGTPFVRAEIDFKHPVTPRHQLLCEVNLVAMGNTSLQFKIVGRQNQIDCFEAYYTCVRVNPASFKPYPGPAAIVRALEHELMGYQQSNCE